VSSEGDTVLHGPTYDFTGLGFARGEVVVVTGGGSGIGLAVALTAAKSGLNVSIWDLDEVAAVAAAAEAESYGVKAQALRVDVNDSREVTEAWRSTLDLGLCRYLVNNAGPKSVFDGTFNDGIRMALGSVDLVTTTWLEHASDDARSVVCTASTAGNFTSSPGANFYAAAKAGIGGYVRQLAGKLGGHPRINAVAPGFTMTPRTVPYLESAAFRAVVERIPMQRAGFPEEIASAICFLLSPAASFINGAVLPVDGGLVVA
jgi:NAD(P)-dependent dehydrogenase (short-subunit alcohol dehydrogenase family)